MDIIGIAQLAVVVGYGFLGAGIISTPKIKTPLWIISVISFTVGLVLAIYS